ncbi:MAG: hypothetical protein JW929_11020 [Anaerolineales bacterium]|nr:hypothetical protein [Anaerolineales bacterium]
MFTDGFFFIIKHRIATAEQAGAGMGAADACEFEKSADEVTKRFSQSLQDPYGAARAETALQQQVRETTAPPAKEEKTVQSKK